jgi:signal transduction histidine kinase/ActR/RegA family two-component response regulator
MHDPATTLTAEERAVLALTDVRAYELSAGRQFVGYLTIGQADSQRTFDESQERVFEELGRRAGLALANALLYQEAQDANRLKDEFLGVVSHELRTPLNAILGWTRLASMHRESGIDSHQALDAIERNAQALARLVDDLLDVPRIMMGKLALDIHALDLVVLLNDAVDAIRPAATSKSLAVELYSELPTAIIEGDEQRLQQVFGNILSNAVKFTPAGGRITMQLRHADDAYTVTVEDTGIGIRKDFLPFVFDRFRQADSSTTRAHGGLGIGLSLVRQLVDMHGGQVTAASGGPGLGSSFTVRLPRTAAEPISPAEIVRPDDAAVARLQGMRLLLLDDDPDAQEVATRTLRSNGAIVQSVASVEEAARVLTHNAEEFDAILADIGLPGQDGYDFIASVRGSPDARLRTLPVVAVTAYASRSDHARAIAAGFDAHVAKPVTLGDLATAVAEAVASRVR